MSTTIKKDTTFRHRKAKCLTVDGTWTRRCVVTCVRQGIAYYRFVNEEKASSCIPLEVFEKYAEDVK